MFLHQQARAKFLRGQFAWGDGNKEIKCGSLKAQASKR